MLTTILLTENDYAMGNYMQDFLELNGYDCLIAGSNLNGIIMALDLDPDIIVYDSNHLQINNWEMKNELDKFYFFTEWPFLFLSAKRDLKHIDGDVYCHADESITRLFMMSSLINSIKQMIDQKYKILIRVQKEQPLFQYLFAN